MTTKLHITGTNMEAAFKENGHEQMCVMDP